MKKIQFTHSNEFTAYYQALGWCKLAGFSAGAMCKDAPIALIYGDVWIAKWRNLTPKERRDAYGVMKSSDYRKGPVIVEIRPEWEHRISQEAIAYMTENNIKEMASEVKQESA